MKGYLIKKKGFTLVELLIVIAIVVMLSSLAVFGYSNYRRSVLLGLSVDDFIGQFNEQKAKTVYAKSDLERVAKIAEALGEGGVVNLVDGNKTSRCYGVYLDFGEENFLKFSSPFLNKKVFNELNGWVYQGCKKFALNDGEFLFENFQIDSNVKISSEIDSIVFRFKPVNGDLEVSLDQGVNFRDPTNLEPFKVEFQYGNENSQQFKKQLIFDFKDEKFVK